jgi:hypothetical protein
LLAIDGKGQTIPVCQVPETKSTASEDSGPVVLPEMFGRERGGFPVKILYLHGWNSVVGGVKPTYLQSHGHEVIEPELDHEDFQAALSTAQRAFDQHQPNVVVGSSRGGAVAVNLESGSARLVLICPAWKKWGMATAVKPGTQILHSPGDDVVPFEDSIKLTTKSSLPGLALIEVGQDHRLADVEPLKALLRVVERRRE